MTSGITFSDIIQTVAVMIAAFAALSLLALFLKAESATWHRNVTVPDEPMSNEKEAKE